MNNQEFQLGLITLIMLLGATLMLLFVLRVIKILTTKKLESKEDFFCFMFIVGIIAVPVFLYHVFKTTKGDSKKTIKTPFV